MGQPAQQFPRPGVSSFVQPDLAALPLAGPDGSPLGELPLLGCTDTPPALREEYDQYTLAQFWPLSLWQSLGGRLGLADAGGTTLRILGGEGITLAGCEALEAQIRPLLEQAGYAFTIENRIGEQLANDRMIAGAQGDPGRVLPAAGGHRAGQRLSQHAGLCGPAPAGVCPLPCRGHDAWGAAQPVLDRGRGAGRAAAGCHPAADRPGGGLYAARQLSGRRGVPGPRAGAAGGAVCRADRRRGGPCLRPWAPAGC